MCLTHENVKLYDIFVIQNFQVHFFFLVLKFMNEVLWDIQNELGTVSSSKACIFQQEFGEVEIKLFRDLDLLSSSM